MKFWLSSLLLFLSFTSVSQDTVSIYFEFGSSRLTDKEADKLGKLSTSYELAELDSIHFVGMADSVGNIKANIRLSEKRAKNVAKNCRALLPENIPQVTFAMGEKSEREDAYNRRVDILLFFPKEIIDPVISREEKEDLLDKCHLH